MAALVITGAHSAPAPSEFEECVRVARLPATRHHLHRLSPTERSELANINGNARELASGYLKVGNALRDAGLNPDEFPHNDLSWAATARGDELLVAIYGRQDGSLVRLDGFGTDGHATLVPRLAILERILASAPTDCGPSFGVLDVGLTSSQGEDLVHALNLVDNSRVIAWGMHYRYSVAEDAIVHAERLHVHCHRMEMKTPEQLYESAGLSVPRSGPRTQNLRRFVTRDSVPDRDLPTETQVMQFVMHGGFNMSIEFWMRNRIFRVEAGELVVPGRYIRFRNPCSVAPAEG